MAGHSLHAAQARTTAQLHVQRQRQPFTQTALKQQQIHRATTLSRRTCKHTSHHRQLTISAASSNDEAVRRPNDAVRSAQDLAEGVQGFLDETQKQFSTDEPPLPEHPIGEEGTIDVAEGIDASVSQLTQLLTQ